MDGLAANGVDVGELEDLRVMVRGDCTDAAEWRKAFKAIWPKIATIKEADYKKSYQHAVGSLETAPVPGWAKKLKIMEAMELGNFDDAVITEEVLHQTASHMNEALEEHEKLHEAESVKKTVAKAEEGRGGLNPLIGSKEKPIISARFIEAFDKDSVKTPPEVRDAVLALVVSETQRQIVQDMKLHGAGPIKEEWRKAPGWMMVRDFMENLAMGMLAAAVRMNSGVELDRAAMTRATDQSGWAEMARCTTETVGKALAHMAKIDKSVTPGGPRGGPRAGAPAGAPTKTQPKAPGGMEGRDRERHLRERHREGLEHRGSNVASTATR